MKNCLPCLRAILLFFPFFSYAQTSSPGVGAPGDMFGVELPAVGSGAPEIGEWTRSGGPDESLVLTGSGLSRFSEVEEGKDSRFMVYGSGGVKKEAKIQRIDGNKAIVTLDGSLPSWSLYLLCPGNDAGWGRPVAVNKADGWWLQNKVTAGMQASVYGRNLAHGNIAGTGNSYVYLKPVGGSGSGQWATVGRVNPYKVEYTVPSSLATGEYELWVHNGHGAEWGWSSPLRLTVVASSDHVLSRSWEAGVTVGAPSSVASSNVANINSAVAGAGSSGKMIQFAAGVYTINGPLNINATTKWKGTRDANGNPTTIIRVSSSFNNAGEGILNRSGNLSMNQFEDIKFESNGFSTDLSNHSLMDIGTPTMVSFVNCYLDAHSVASSLRCGGGMSNLYLDNCKLYGGVDQWSGNLFLDGGRQVFIKNCTIKQTNDTESAIVTRNMSQASVENTTFQDYDNSTTDGSGWGKGRIWSSNGAGGSVYHCYFGDNKGTGLGTRQSGTNVPDPNSGEMFLWEGNIAAFNSAVASSSSTTITLNSTLPQGKEYSIAIIKGKGLGQVRRITASSGSTATLDKAWQVVPDGSSVVAVGPFVDGIVFYKNQLDANGKSYITHGDINSVTASGGFVAYGGCFNFIGDGNSLTGLRTGISTWATQHSPGALDPTYFCLYTNNKMVGCGRALHTGSDAYSTSGAAALLGMTYRRNVVQNPVITAVHNELKDENMAGTLTTTIYEHNSYSNAPRAFTTGPLWNSDIRVHYGAKAMENHLFYKNNFQGAGSGIHITSKIALRENLYQGLSSIYEGSLPGTAVVEAPYHVVEIEAPAKDTLIKTPFTILNAGTAAMNWTASSNTPWLKLESLTGVILHEGEKSIIELQTNAKGLAEGTYKTSLTINTPAGKSQVYTVVLKVGNFTAQPTAPSIALTSPTSGSNFTAPATIAITADASDADGSITKVEFFNGTTKLGEDLSAPYSFNWSGVAQGNYTITAKATDNGGLSSSSPSLNLILGETVLKTDTIINNTTNACDGRGKISWEYWKDVKWTGSLYVPADREPTETKQLPSFSTPERISDYYAARIRGYICPPQTGYYTFYLTADNLGGLWLSTNESPQNKQKIASVDSWTNPNQYQKYASQESKSIYLEVGKRYYVEALYVEEYGGDHLSVGWKLPNGTLQRPIEGTNLIPYTGPTASARMATMFKETIEEANKVPLNADRLTIYPNPFREQTVIEFSLTATSNVSLQVFNQQGALVKTIYQGNINAGALTRFTFNSANLASGVYICRLVSGKTTLQQQMVLIK